MTREKWRRVVFDLRTEGAGPGREAAAIGLGAFVGCLPLYGLHLLICLGLGWLLRLNRLKMYLAANVSNPLFLPFLLLIELQSGSWWRTGRLRPLTLQSVTAIDPWMFGRDLLTGSLIIGILLGVAAAALTYAAVRDGSTDPGFGALARRASERYVRSSLTAFEFASAKLRTDPVYRAALCDGMWSAGATLLDIGCGQGLMLALLAEARHVVSRSSPPTSGSPLPVFDRLVGIELRPRVARLAQQALGDEAQIIQGDADALTYPTCSAAVLIDVLQMMPRDTQERLLAGVRGALLPGGVLLVREANPCAGWRFALVRTANRFKALAGGAWRQRFCYRTPEDWLASFRAIGFDAEVCNRTDRGPLGNVLFRVSVPNP